MAAKPARKTPSEVDRSISAFSDEVARTTALVLQRKLLSENARGCERLNIERLYKDKRRSLRRAEHTARVFCHVMRESTIPAFVSLAIWQIDRYFTVAAFRRRGWLKD